MFLGQGLCLGLVACFRRGEGAEQAAGLDIGRAAGCRDIEVPRLALHVLRFGPDAVEAQILDQPDRLAAVEIRDMLAPDRQDDLAEALAVEVEQALAVAVLFLRHAVEHRGRGGIAGAQGLGIGLVDAPILLLGGDGEGKDLALREIVEAALAAEARQGEAGEHGVILFGIILI